MWALVPGRPPIMDIIFSYTIADWHASRDALKDDRAANHRFRIPITSFEDFMGTAGDYGLNHAAWVSLAGCTGVIVIFSIIAARLVMLKFVPRLPSNVILI
jgi:hypothetical protein